MSIEVQRISKTFGSYAALRDVSLTVPEGELVALLGPSGSGKTTLLRIIAGLEAPDEADGAVVLLDGQDVLRRAVRERRVGFVFQHYALFRNMNVFENVAFGLKVRSRKTRPPRRDIERKVRELLHLVQLEGLERRHPSQLSGGQRQRVALARALAVEPKVLLLDEPFGALDARVRQELRRWLRRLHDEIHVTSVFVTHDQEEALEVADRIVVMDQGKIQQVGSPDEVFHRPANEFVMQFLGNVNLFHGRVEHGRGIFGPLVVDGGQRAARDGKARLLVRPHELELHLQPNGKAAMGAWVTRVLSAGAVVKVELRDEQGETLHAEISHERQHELALSEHDRVFVSLRESRVFTDDYCI